MACNSLWSFGQDRQQGQQETLASKFSFLAATAPKPTTKFVHINGSPKQPGKGSSRQKQKVSNCEPQIVSNLMKAGKKSVPKTGHEAISNLKSGTTHFTNLVELKKKKTRRLVLLSSSLSVRQILFIAVLTRAICKGVANGTRLFL